MKLQLSYAHARTSSFSSGSILLLELKQGNWLFFKVGKIVFMTYWNKETCILKLVLLFNLTAFFKNYLKSLYIKARQLKLWKVWDLNEVLPFSYVGLDINGLIFITYSHCTPSCHMLLSHFLWLVCIWSVFYS